MKVGVFDSGVGGLTVLKAIRNRFPNIDLVYLGDTARVPYGNRSPETVIRYSLECAGFLMERGIEVLVIACNTASSYAIEELKKKLPVPVVGVVEPGVREAVRVSRGRVGVIGTRATVRSGSYQRLLKEAGLEVIARACPLFVPLVEEGVVEGEIAEKVVRMYLEDFLRIGVDTLILGCTHYPLLKGVISRVLKGVHIVDSSEAVARDLDGVVLDEGEGTTEVYFTDRSQDLERIVELITGERIQPVLVGGGSQPDPPF
ncbi:MAG: glutamate racemase [Aquificota bacterium]|nr:glutamate racemase [Aquificota bacterium]